MSVPEWEGKGASAVLTDFCDKWSAEEIFIIYSSVKDCPATESVPRTIAGERGYKAYHARPSSEVSEACDCR